MGNLIAIDMGNSCLRATVLDPSDNFKKILISYGLLDK